MKVFVFYEINKLGFRILTYLNNFIQPCLWFFCVKMSTAFSGNTIKSQGLTCDKLRYINSMFTWN